MRFAIRLKMQVQHLLCLGFLGYYVPSMALARASSVILLIEEYTYVAY